jgi:hypothetical protein
MAAVGHFSDLVTASRDVRSSEQNRPRRFYDRRRNGCHRLFGEWAVMECSHARAEQTWLEVGQVRFGDVERRSF